MQGLAGAGLAGLAARPALGSAGAIPQAGPSHEDATESFEIMEGMGGELVVQQLRASGVHYIFHTNTSGVESILDACVNLPDMHVMMVTHEGQALAAAEGLALASGRLAFSLASKVGVGNAISNLYNAWIDRSPQIAAFGRMPLLTHGDEGRVEEWDEKLQPTAPFTRWYWSCVDAATIPEILRRGMRFAVAGTGGPVALDFSQDLLRTRIRAPIYHMDPLSTRTEVRASAAQIEQAARWLAEAEHPAIVAGAEVTRGRANAALQELAEKLSVPVFLPAVHGGLFSEFPTDHPLFVGTYWSPPKFPRHVDVFMNFGASLRSEKPPPPPAGSKYVYVTREAVLLEDRDFPTQLSLEADVGPTLQDISAALDGMLTRQRMARIRQERLAQVSSYVQEVRKSRHLALRANFDKAPLSWERVGYELDRALDKNAVVVPELGSEGPKLLSQLTCGGDHKLRLGRTLGQALGWGLAAALGVNLAFPGRQVAALLGDGGFMFGQSETLWSVARYQAPMLIVIMNNHSYNETRNRNLGFGGDQFFEHKDLTSYLGSPDVDYVKVAEAYGLAGEHVKQPSELAPALQRALGKMRDGQAVLLDIETARDGIASDSTYYPHYSIWEHGRRIGKES
jgi:thiamine pyrophosphate-dependent acetolactate synthase large subunit-like protein